MAKWIGAAILAATFMLGGSVAISPAAAAPLQKAVRQRQTDPVADLGARRRLSHHHRDACCPTHPPYYDDRPYYYAPAPFFPYLGLGYGP